MISLLLCLALSGQEVEWIEIRFHRVHLRNGNFIDGALISQTEREVVLKMKVGNIAIRGDSVDFVESMKIRSIRENPPVLAKPAALAPSVRAKGGGTRLLELPEGAAAITAQVLPLLDRYRETAPENRYAVMSQIISIEGGIAPLLTCLLETADEEVRSILVEALTILKDRKSLPLLVKLLAAEDPGLRAQATALIGGLGPSGSSDSIRALLKDPSPTVRAAAATALQLMDDENALGDVISLCADEDRVTRGRAINSTLELARRHERMEEASRGLTRLIDRMEGTAKADVVMALGKTGVPESVPPLLSLLNDPDPAVRAQAVQGLGHASGRDSSEGLLNQLSREREIPVRLELLWAVQRRKLMEAVGTVIPWTSDPEPEIQKAASKILTSLTGQSFGTDYGRWASWWAKAKPRD